MTSGRILRGDFELLCTKRSMVLTKATIPYPPYPFPWKKSMLGVQPSTMSDVFGWRWYPYFGGYHVTLGTPLAESGIPIPQEWPEPPVEVIHLPGTHTPAKPVFSYNLLYWYSKCFSESILWGHVWELAFNLFLVICSICLTICSSFLQKMAKTKNRKTWVCLFFFGGIVSRKNFCKKNISRTKP